MLNLSGLGAGYAYLGRWGRLVTHLLVTFGLVAAAFVSDGARRPWIWRVIAAAWIAWMVCDGFRQGSRLTPAPDRLPMLRRVAPAAVAGLLAVTVAGGYSGYVVAGRRAFAAALTAHEAGNCQAALTGYGKITGFYELTLSPNVGTAQVNTQQCEAFLLARQSQDRGFFADAVAQYHDFRRMHPNAILIPLVEEKLTATYFSWAMSLQDIGGYADAIDVYEGLLEEDSSPEVEDQARDGLAQTYFEQADLLRSQVPVSTGDQLLGSTSDVIDNYLFILRNLSDTAVAEDVPAAIVDTYNQALAPFHERRYCEAAPILDYFASLTDPETAGVAAMAHGPRAQAMFECGVEKYRSSDFNGAIGDLEKLVAAYPDNALVPQAKSALIVARIAKVKGQGTGQLPPPLAGDSPGSIAVTIYNDSPLPMTVLVGGPTAHEIFLEACPSCPRFSASGAGACLDSPDKPAATLLLTPGQYDIVAQYPDDPTIEPLLASRSIESDFTYSECFYIGRQLLGSTQPLPST